MNIEGSTSKSPEESPEEEKEIKRIRSIINRMFEKPEAKEDASSRNMKLAKELMKIGSPAVKVIIEGLSERAEKNALPSPKEEWICGSPVFNLLRAIEKTAEHFPEAVVGHAKELIKILLSDPGFSNRGKFLGILRQIGNHDPSRISIILPGLEEYKLKLNQIDYSSFTGTPEMLKRIDQEYIDKVIEHLQKIAEKKRKSS